MRMLEGLALCDRLEQVEVVLVDDGSAVPLSTGGLPDKVPVRVLHNETPIGAARSRNRAADASAGTILAFLDDDTVPVPDWITEVLSAFNDGANAVTGPVLRFDHDLVARARQARYDLRYKGLLNLQQVSFFAGGNSAVCRSLFLQAGGFRNAGVGGDNTLVQDLAALGQQVLFLRRMKILHRNSKGLPTALRTAYAAGRNTTPQARCSELLREFTARRNAVGDQLDERLINQIFASLYLFGQLRARMTQRRIGETA
jgi:GT2 family glycosyltransferase